MKVVAKERKKEDVQSSSTLSQYAFAPTGGLKLLLPGSSGSKKKKKRFDSELLLFCVFFTLTLIYQINRGQFRISKDPHNSSKWQNR